MARVVERVPHGRDVAGDARRGLVVDDEHGADGSLSVLHILRQTRGDAGGVRRVPPVPRQNLDVEAQVAGEVSPFRSEEAVAPEEDPVAGGERVHEGGLPAAAGGGREDEDVRGVSEHPFQSVEQPERHLAELGSAVVDAGPVHGLEYALGHGGRARKLGEVSAAAVGQGWLALVRAGLPPIQVGS